MDKEMMKGSVDILVLSIISHYDTYGYEIIQKLKEQSNDAYHMRQGTLYPALTPKNKDKTKTNGVPNKICLSSTN